jgi:glyoxylase-like metal-dependent hydrolase (beta-lactamase superfamily II)
LIRGEKNILVDPGYDYFFGNVLRGLSELSLKIQDIDFIFITHGHPDHIEALSRFKDTFAMAIVSEVEMEFLKATDHYGDFAGYMDLEPEIFAHEGCFNAGEMEFQIVSAPGHSPGSLCLYWIDKNTLFTGDVVFDSGVGRTDLPGGNGQRLKESIQRISRFPADYLLPGHGMPILEREKIKENFKAIENIWFEYI